MNRHLRDIAQLAGLPTIGILSLAFVIWVFGCFVISPIFQNTGYLAFLQWEMVSPTLITLFLYFRSIRQAESRNRSLRLHVAWLATLTVVIYLGRRTWIGYHAMDDAPRGLLWDFYQFAALIYGAAAFWLCFACGLPFAQKPNQANKSCAATDDDLPS